MIDLLIVSDTGETVQPFRRHLRAFGCRYDTAANGLEALDALREADYDAVVVAMSHGANGVAHEIVRSLRAAYPGQVVSVLLPDPTAARQQELVESGASVVVPTPCTPGEFLTRLMAAMVR